MIPRGIRQNNPGNLKDFGIPWDGLVDQDEHGLDAAGFCVFRFPEYGIRAMAKQIRTNYIRHQCRNIRRLIERWAPDNGENPHQDNYVAFVAEWINSSQWRPVDLLDPRLAYGVIEAITHFENGQQPYAPGQIRLAMYMAGFEMLPDLPTEDPNP